MSHTGLQSSLPQCTLPRLSPRFQAVLAAMSAVSHFFPMFPGLAGSSRGRYLITMINLATMAVISIRQNRIAPTIVGVEAWKLYTGWLLDFGYAAQQSHISRTVTLAKAGSANASMTVEVMYSQ